MMVKDSGRRIINIYWDDTDEKVPKKDRVLMKVSAEYVQWYDNAWKYTEGLNSVQSFRFLYWMVFNAMDDKNLVDISQESRRKYLEHLQSLDVKDIPTLRTVSRAVSELVQAHILLRTGRGKYMANPVIVWKSSIQLRQKTIAMFIEAKINIGIPPIRIKRKVEDTENDIEQSASESEEVSNGTPNS